MKILFITQICPYPPSNGGAIKTFNILKGIGAEHNVRLIAFIRRDDEIESLSHLSAYCSKIDSCMIKRSGMKNLIDAAKSIILSNSFIITRDYQPEMAKSVEKAIDWQPDIIYIDHLQMFQYVPNHTSCPVVLDNHNVEWRIIERFASSGRSAAQRLFASAEWKKLRQYELSACRKADLVLTVTDKDKEILASNGIASEKVLDLPIGVDTEKHQPVTLKKESLNILSIGTMSWPPNIDSVLYFTKKIYPLIKQKIPGATFTVAGANPPQEIVELSRKDPSITVTGYIDDIRSVTDEAAVFVVPLQVGSGMRVKILDAMAMGLPIVTTSIGCEGIAVTPDEHALIADTPDDFAKSVIHLLSDHNLRIQLGIAGRELAAKQYSWEPIIGRLNRRLLDISRK